ncbi:Uncharacterised protein [Vibrio cholerae]|nr:Uncharacterised protein [Vibrio cholerae]CSI76120.1 Uncharacterised protein [Vibrio cholerae]
MPVPLILLSDSTEFAHSLALGLPTSSVYFAKLAN